MKYVYPRLDGVAATTLVNDYTGISVKDLVPYADNTHPRADWYPTGQARMSRDGLDALAAMVRQLAGQHGYPDQERHRKFASFDQELSGLLLDQMQILPADAAHEGVWSFLSLVLLPDVAVWRFPNRDRKEDYERLIGRPRNVFRRLWWRAFCLGSDVSGQLLEDEAVGIMERPTFGLCPSLARQLAQTHLRCVRDHPALPRTALLRDATKRLRRLAPAVLLYALTSTDLAALLSEVFAESIQAMTDPTPSNPVSS